MKIATTIGLLIVAAVTLFMAPWCSFCMGAKAYLAEHHITYREFVFDPQDAIVAIYNR